MQNSTLIWIYPEITLIDVTCDGFAASRASFAEQLSKTVSAVRLVITAGESLT